MSPRQSPAPCYPNGERNGRVQRRRHSAGRVPPPAHSLHCSLMHADIEEALNAIARLHGKQLAACEALRDLMLEMVRPWRGTLLDPARPEDALLAALLARSAKTFWGSRCTRASRSSSTSGPRTASVST